MNSGQSLQNQNINSIKDKDNSLQNTDGSSLTFKIKDSLYIGTSIDAFKDQQFILLNWIETVIVLQTHQHKFDNTLKQLYGQENDYNNNIQNQPQQQYIRYLHCTPQLFINQIQKLNQYHSQNQNKLAINFQQIFNFIETAQQNGTSCLILASSYYPNIQTTGYIFTISTAYLMKKYQWSLYKSLQYMNAKHPNASINQQSLQFLNNLQIQLMKNTTLTYNWQEWKNHEELIIRNTFINAKQSNWNETLTKHKNNQKNNNIQKLKDNQTNSKKQITNQTNSDSISQFQQSQLKSILKNHNIKQKQTFTSKRNKIKVLINQQLNNVKQFFPNSQNKKVYETEENEKVSSQTLILQQINKSQQNQNQKRQTFKTARNQRISLSVRNIVAKYRNQKNQINSDSKNQSMTNSKKISFDNCFQISTKSLNKKKSFYNFQSCQKNQAIKTVKDQNNDGILRIVNKLKTQNDVQKVQQMELRKLQTLPQQNYQPQKLINNLTQQKNKSNSDTNNLFTTSQLEKNKSWLQIINKKRSSNENSLKKTSNKQSLPKNKHNKENQTNKKNEIKQNQNKIYIKEINKNINNGLTEGKMSINQKLFCQQSGRKKNKNLIIEYQDFKQMIKNKQKSIGNLALLNIQNSKKKQNLQKNQKIASVIQKLKKESFQNLSLKVSSRPNTNQTKAQSKNMNTKQFQVKWR